MKKWQIKGKFKTTGTFFVMAETEEQAVQAFENGNEDDFDADSPEDVDFKWETLREY